MHVDEARRNLQQAIDRYQRQIDGTEPTDAASQQQIFDDMHVALHELQSNDQIASNDERWRLMSGGIGLALGLSGLGLSLSLAMHRPWIAAAGAATGIVGGILYVRHEVRR